MSEDEGETALRSLATAAGLLALRVCVTQMLADRMRERDNPEAALRTFDDEVQRLLEQIPRKASRRGFTGRSNADSIFTTESGGLDGQALQHGFA